MERTILFKAKRLDNGEWVEGYYVKKVAHKQTPKGDVVEDGEEHLIFGMTKTDVQPYWHEVDPSTVCQFTGLRDSKDVNIFEGDILDMVAYCDFDEIYDVSLEESKERFTGIVTWDKFRYVLESTPQYTEKNRKEKWDCLNMLTDDGWHSISLVCGSKFDRKEGEQNE